MRGRKGSRAETAELMQEFQRAESEKARLLLKIGEYRKSGAPDEKLARYYLEGWGIAGRKRRGVFGYKALFLG
nr:MAG TPA: hypothetical protein [Caudoviricetes sp.]